MEPDCVFTSFFSMSYPPVLFAVLPEHKTCIYSLASGWARFLLNCNLGGTMYLYYYEVELTKVMVGSIHLVPAGETGTTGAN